MKGKIVCFGELLIDFVPTVNGVSLAEAEAFKKAPGGAPANVAVGLARLGQPAAFLGKVGDDEFGHMLADVLAQNGVDVSPMRFDDTARTALAFVTLRADGEREFMFYRHPSADMLLTPDELDQKLISEAAIFHYGSISLVSEPCRSAHLAAMKIARDGGALLSYDPNLRLPLWPDTESAKKGILSIWREADVIKISEDELIFLTGENSDGAARSLWHDRLKLLLVTEGQEGSRFYTRNSSGRSAGFTVPAVDTTGAGDAFVAAFLSRLKEASTLWDHPVELVNALSFANAAGALTTTGRGAIPSLPDAAAIQKLLTQKKPA